MKYMMLIYGAEDAWTEAERAACMEESAGLCDELHASGKFLGASPLHPVASATSVRVRGGKRVVTDGPFAETTEQLGGYYVVEAADLDDVIAIAGRVPGARKGTVEIRPVVEPEGLPFPADGEGQIRRVIAEQDAALAAKDIDAMIANFADGAVLYDLKPPFVTTVADLRQGLETCMPYMPDGFAVETHELNIEVCGTLAHAHRLWTMTGIPDDHPAAGGWFRTTTVFRKRGGAWKITHDHCSIPFDFAANQPVFTPEPLAARA